MATETMTETTHERAAQVRIHLKAKSEDIQLPETGPILVSTGKLRRDVHLDTRDEDRNNCNDFELVAIFMKKN